MYYHNKSDWFSITITSRQFEDAKLEVFKKVGKAEVTFYRYVNDSYIQVESQSNFEEFLRAKLESLYVFDIEE